MRKKTTKTTIKKYFIQLLVAILIITASYSFDVHAVDVNDLRIQANEVFQADNKEEAYVLYSQIVEMGQGNSNDYWRLALLESERNENMKAVEHYLKSEELYTGTDFNYESMYKKLAQIFNTEGMYWATEAVYEASLEKMDEVPINLKWNYAMAFKFSGRYAEAVSIMEEVYDAFLANSPEDSGIGTILYQMGECYRNLQRYDEAEQCYESSLMYAEKNASYLNGMRLIKVANQDMDLDVFINEYMSEYNNYEVAQLISNWGYNEEAIPYYEAADDEMDEDLRYEIAWNYAYLGETDTARTMLEKLVEEGPDNVGYLNGLGALYCDYLGEYEKAMECFDKALEIYPDADSIRENCAIVYGNMGKYEEADQIYADLYAKYPTDQNYINKYLNSNSDLTPEEALEVYSTYGDWPENSQLQAMVLANNLSSTNRSVASMECFLEYYQSNNIGDANYTLSMEEILILEELEKYNEAIFVVDLWIDKTDVERSNLYMQKAECYQGLGDYERALIAYETSCEVPSNRAIVSWKFNNAIYAGDMEAAKEYVDNYAKEIGEEEELASMYMIWAAQTKDYEMLRKYSEMQLNENPSSVKAKAYNALALRELGLQAEYEAMVADIDSANYSSYDMEKIVADCILGRIGDAKDRFCELKEYNPGWARSYRNDYELKMMFYDPEFCAMAERSVIIVIPEFDLPGDN